MPRPTWLRQRAELLVAELDSLGLETTAFEAEEYVAHRLSAVAAQMRISEVSARRYVGDAQVQDVAREVAFRLVDERPGANALDMERDTRVAVRVLGHTIAGLAESGQVHLLAEDGFEAAKRARRSYVPGL